MRVGLGYTRRFKQDDLKSEMHLTAASKPGFGRSILRLPRGRTAVTYISEDSLGLGGKSDKRST